MKLVYHLIILLFCSVLNTHAQQGNLELNYNQESTLVGLKAGSKTYITPTYHQLYRLYLGERSSETKYFVAKKEELYGLVTGFGEILIPIQYDSISRALNQIIQFKKENKWGLIDLHNDIVLAAEYDALIFKSDSTFIYKKGGLYGLMNFDFKVLTPPRFNNLEFYTSAFWEEGSSETTSNHIFYATEGEESGIYDVDQNFFISTKAHIYCQWTDKHDPNSEATYYYQDDQSRFTFYNNKGELLGKTNADIDFSFHYYSPDSLSRKKHFMATHTYLLIYNHTEKCQYIYNVNSTEKSKNYSKIHFHYDKVIFEDSTGWGILDAHFNLLYYTTEYMPSVDGYAYYMETGEQNFYSVPYLDQHKWTPRANLPYVYFYKPYKTPYEKWEFGYSYYATAGILNYKTKKSIPPSISDFIRSYPEMIDLFMD